MKEDEELAAGIGIAAMIIVVLFTLVFLLSVVQQ